MVQIHMAFNKNLVFSVQNPKTLRPIQKKKHHFKTSLTTFQKKNGALYRKVIGLPTSIRGQHPGWEVLAGKQVLAGCTSPGWGPRRFEKIPVSDHMFIGTTPLPVH